MATSSLLCTFCQVPTTSVVLEPSMTSGFRTRKLAKKGVMTEADTYQGLPAGIEPVRTSKGTAAVVIRSLLSGLVYLNPEHRASSAGLTA